MDVSARCTLSTETVGDPRLMPENLEDLGPGPAGDMEMDIGLGLSTSSSPSVGLTKVQIWVELDVAVRKGCVLS